MFKDAVKFAKACPECAIVTETGRNVKPVLQPIPVSRHSQILGYGSLTNKERKQACSVVIQDLFTKWPFVFAVPDQKTTRIARLKLSHALVSLTVLLGERERAHLVMQLARFLYIQVNEKFVELKRDI